MIDGVHITPLKQFVDERGSVMHMMRNDDPLFEQFGEIYFSCVHPGAIKAWHLHSEMTLNYACVSGIIKMVLFDGRKGSATQNELMEIYLGEKNYSRVKVPPGVWNGFKGTGTATAIVANCATHPHSKDEISRVDPFENDIPYDWALKHG